MCVMPRLKISLVVIAICTVVVYVLLELSGWMRYSYINTLCIVVISKGDISTKYSNGYTLHWISQIILYIKTDPVLDS